MRIASLGSGSNGNATILEAGLQQGQKPLRLLIDSGFSIKQCSARLAKLQLNLEDINAVLLTHEHNDHSMGVLSLVKKYSLPLYLTRGTALALKLRADQLKIHYITPNVEFSIDKLKIVPVPVPHDAREAVQFVFKLKQNKLGILTDLGSATECVIEAYENCNLLLVEANHDLAMLASCSYPSHLKRRVGGNWGHLNNQQTADLITEINRANQLRHLIIGHISENSNKLNLVKETLQEVTQSIPSVIYVSQNEGSGWVSLN